MNVALAYANRVVELVRAGGFDLVWIEKEALPYVPGPLERILTSRRVPIVVDYDDAQFHVYDQHPKALVRRLLGSKIDGVMRRASLVVAGNEYLAQHAQEAGAARVEILPTVVDTKRYDVERPPHSSPYVVGWVGTPKTEHLVDQIAGPLKEVATQRDIEVALVGASATKLTGVPIQIRRWSEATESTEIARFDVGVMPLSDAPFQRGKCGYKLVQYMACALPVIASPVGVNTVLVEDGVNGFLAATSDDWVASILRLVDHPDDGSRMGRRGREKVEREYSLEVTAPRLAGLLLEIAAGQ
jgi:glycosyltransferase involved in cell wall biosynthesis